MLRYDIRTGVKKIKTKTFMAISVIGIAATGTVGSLAIWGSAHAAFGGPVCNVPSDYTTIQSAVSDPGCTTVNVAPGVYAENVNITHTLTLNGAQAGNPISGRNFGSPSESALSGVDKTASIPVVNVDAANVVVDGFSITNSVTSGASQGVAISGNGNNAIVKNNLFDSVTTAGVDGQATAQAVYLYNGPDGVQVLNNSVNNVSSNRSAKGVLLGDNGAANGPTNTTIQGNSFTNIVSTAKGAYGVSLGSTVQPISGLQILGNTFNGLTGNSWVHVIGVEGNAPGIVVTGNSITGISSPTTDKIAVWIENEDTSFTSAKINNNNFNVPAPIFGIAVHPSLTGGSLDGTCNWWNSITGPTVASNPSGTGAATTTGVTYSPWLGSPSGACGNVATNKDQCKGDGWMSRFDSNGNAFKNQGDCVSFVATGGRNTASPKVH
jgi:hypothetical protein